VTGWSASGTTTAVKAALGASLAAALVTAGAMALPGDRGEPGPGVAAPDVAAPDDAAPDVASPGVPAPDVARTAAGRTAAAAPLQQFEEIPYDGRFTFLRVYFEAGGGGLRGGFRGRGGRGEPPWAHDYPRAETNFAKILSETTMMTPYMEGSRVLPMDDPEIFKYPVIYMVEVGYWRPSDEEIAALGAYLEKGGFLIVDDFRDRQLYPFIDVIQRALPGIQPLEMPTDHEIFDAFFRIEDPYALIPPYGRSRPVYLGLFENNDPNGRLMAILNYNNDIAEYWEFSDRGYYPIDLNNDAFKFGVNYIVYAMTH